MTLSRYLIFIPELAFLAVGGHNKIGFEFFLGSFSTFATFFSDSISAPCFLRPFNDNCPGQNGRDYSKIRNLSDYPILLAHFYFFTFLGEGPGMQVNADSFQSAIFADQPLHSFYIANEGSDMFSTLWIRET